MDTGGVPGVSMGGMVNWQAHAQQGMMTMQSMPPNVQYIPPAPMMHLAPLSTDIPRELLAMVKKLLMKEPHFLGLAHQLDQLCGQQVCCQITGLDLVAIMCLFELDGILEFAA